MVGHVHSHPIVKRKVVRNISWLVANERTASLVWDDVFTDDDKSDLESSNITRDDFGKWYKKFYYDHRRPRPRNDTLGHGRQQQAAATAAAAAATATTTTTHTHNVRNRRAMENRHQKRRRNDDVVNALVTNHDDTVDGQVTFPPYSQYNNQPDRGHPTNPISRSIVQPGRNNNTNTRAVNARTMNSNAGNPNLQIAVQGFLTSQDNTQQNIMNALRLTTTSNNNNRIGDANRNDGRRLVANQSINSQSHEVGVHDIDDTVRGGTSNCNAGNSSNFRTGDNVGGIGSPGTSRRMTNLTQGVSRMMQPPSNRRHGSAEDTDMSSQQHSLSPSSTTGQQRQGQQQQEQDRQYSNSFASALGSRSAGAAAASPSIQRSDMTERSSSSAALSTFPTGNTSRRHQDRSHGGDSASPSDDEHNDEVNNNNRRSFIEHRNYDSDDEDDDDEDDEDDADNTNNGRHNVVNDSGELFADHGNEDNENGTANGRTNSGKDGSNGNDNDNAEPMGEATSNDADNGRNNNGNNGGSNNHNAEPIGAAEASNNELNRRQVRQVNYEQYDLWNRMRVSLIRHGGMPENLWLEIPRMTNDGEVQYRRLYNFDTVVNEEPETEPVARLDSGPNDSRRNNFRPNDSRRNDFRLIISRPNNSRLIISRPNNSRRTEPMGAAAAAAANSERENNYELNRQVSDRQYIWWQVKKNHWITRNPGNENVWIEIPRFSNDGKTQYHHFSDFERVVFEKPPPTEQVFIWEYSPNVYRPSPFVLTEDELNQLPAIEAGPVLLGVRPTCMFCSVDFNEGDRVIFAPCCVGSFHEDCICKWMGEQQPRCPGCNANYRAADNPLAHSMAYKP